MHRLLTTEEAAALLRLNPLTLYRWRKAEKGPPFTRVGARIYYEREMLERWLVENRHQPEKAA